MGDCCTEAKIKTLKWVRKRISDSKQLFVDMKDAYPSAPMANEQANGRIMAYDTVLRFVDAEIKRLVE